MNEVIRTIMDRKSVRDYEEKKISEEEKRLILQAACAAPTAGNQQLYTIIDVTDQDIKDALVKTCDDQHRVQQTVLFSADGRGRILMDCRIHFLSSSSRDRVFDVPHCRRSG